MVHSFHRSGFDNADRACRRDDGSQLEPGRDEDIPEPRPGPHATASASVYPEYHHIRGHGIPEPKALPRLTPGRHNPLDKQNFAALANHLAAVPQRDNGLIIPPNDQEIRHDVSVAAADHAFKGITADKTATIRQPTDGDSLLRTRRGPRQIEHDAGRPRIHSQDLRHQRAVAAADVDHPLELPKIIGVDRRAMPVPHFSCHRSIK